MSAHGSDLSGVPMNFHGDPDGASKGGAVLYLQSLAGDRYEADLMGLESLSMSEFREGNIILLVDVQVSGQWVDLKIEASYGAEVEARCQRIEWRADRDWTVR